MSEYLKRARLLMESMPMIAGTKPEAAILNILAHLEAQEQTSHRHQHGAPWGKEMTGPALPPPLPETPQSGATSNESSNASPAATTPSIPATVTGEPISSTSEPGPAWVAPVFLPPRPPLSKITEPSSFIRGEEAAPGPSASTDECYHDWALARITGTLTGGAQRIYCRKCPQTAYMRYTVKMESAVPSGAPNEH